MRNGVEIKDHTGWALEGNVFYDGSCLQRGCNGLSRATWAAVQLGPDNQVVASVSGPVWRSLPQTAQAAEHCARAAAVQILKGPARLIGDSRNIVAAANKPRQISCHHSKMHAAASRVAADAIGADHVLDDTWVRAHRKPEDAQDAWDRYTAIGNGLADAEAVAAQTRFEHASIVGWQRVEAMQAKMRIICRTIGTIAALWPAARQSCGLVERQPGIAAPAKVPMASTSPHNWAHDGGKWVCIVCLTFAHDDAHQARRRHEHCPGYCAQLAKVLSGRWGHALAAVDTEGAPFVICLRCGAWGASNPTHLLAKCPQVLYPRRKQAFKRIAKQTHPSYYGTQPKIVAVVPFAVNEQLAQQIRSREPAKRVNAPLVTAAAASTHGERTEARVQRLRDRLASRLRAGEALPEPASKAARGEGGEALRARAEALRVSEEARRPPPPPPLRTMARQRRRASAVQGVGSRCGKVLERNSNANGVTVPKSERGAKDLTESGGAGRRRWSRRRARCGP